MKKPLLVISLLITIVCACNNSDKTINRLLKAGKLPTQTFDIDITKDTVLITQKGALIRIPKGALSADNNRVQLEVKEAYSMRDIVKAGLTTQSDGQLLSSGGMIYINAVGENNVRIKQKIFVATPTSSINPNMQLWKGEVKSDSSINWTNPAPLAENPQLMALEKGKAIFQDNCASCHALGKDLTGPNLAHFIKRWKPFWGEGGITHPYNFTRNPIKVMATDGYYCSLKKKFGGVVMTAFPNLTDEDLDNIYGYIENESERLNLPIPDNGLMRCRDSCRQYIEVAGKWAQIKATLEKDSMQMTNDNRPVQPTPAAPERVNPADNKSLYYQFTIESFGWYNVDILLKGLDGVQPSELMVRIQGQYKERFDIYLIIPSIKLMAPGGQLKGKKDVYGFYDTDGNIPLPQQAQAYIIAFGEYEDKIIFAKKEFITQEKQSLDLELTTITKEAFEQQMNTMQLSDVTFRIDESKNAEQLRRAVKELKSAEGLKPKNCDCDCFKWAEQPHEVEGTPAGPEY